MSEGTVWLKITLPDVNMVVTVPIRDTWSVRESAVHTSEGTETETRIGVTLDPEAAFQVHEKFTLYADLVPKETDDDE